MLSSEFTFFLDLDSVLVANSESVNIRTLPFLTNGWMKLCYIAEALLCVCFVEIEFNPERMNPESIMIMWDCVLSSRMVV